MRRNLKKIFLTFLSAAMIFSSAPALGKITVNMPQTIYSGHEENILSSGVTHENIKRFTASGWHNINVIKVDLTNPYTNIQGIFNQDGIPKKDSVSGMVEKSGAVAGINGDFFNFKPLASAMGTLINNGEMISSPIEMAYALPTFFIDTEKGAQVGYMDRWMVAKNENSDIRVIINTINKVTPNCDSVTLLNKHWGKQSIGKKFHRDLIEVVVENDIVSDVRVGQDAVSIPTDGYVLAVRGKNTQALETFQKGDKILLDISTTPNINNIKFAIGGGSIILKEGELSLSNINIKGAQPRSGIGVSKDGKQLILATIDGRGTSFKGVSQEMFGYILRDLGAYNALNLDGGGSTTMAIRPVDDKKTTVVNRPSDGGERRVVNSVGVFSNAPVEELSYIKISTDNNKMFLNTSRTLKAKGYDKHHNPVPVNNEKIVYTVEGVESEVKGNTFKALSSGTAKVSAKYDDIVANLDITVLGPVEDLTTNVNSFNLNTNSETNLPGFSGKDANGYLAPIYLRDITFETTNDIGHVKADKFFSGDKSVAGILTAKIGNGVENIEVFVGSMGETIYGFENVDSLSFSSYPEAVTGSIGLSDESKEGNKSVFLKYDFSKAQDTRAAYLNFSKEEGKGLAIKGYPSKLGIWVKGDNSGSWLRGNVIDKNGKSHFIDFIQEIDFTDWKYLEANLPSNISYPIVLERIYPVETNNLNKQSGTLLLDGLTAYYPPRLGDVKIPKPSVLKDNQNIKAALENDGFTFSVTADSFGLNDIVKHDVETDIKSRISKSKIGVILNGNSPEFRNGIKNYAVINAAGAYSTNKHKNVCFIHANSSKGGLRESNPNQWKSLIYHLENREEDNIVLFLTSPIFGRHGFKDPLEADLLHDYLVKTRESGKNIFVIQGSNNNSSDLNDGIRYIELNTQKAKSPADINNLSIVEFVVNPNNTTYQISPLFSK